MSKTPRSEAVEAFSDAFKAKRDMARSSAGRFFIDPNYPHVIADGGKDFGGLQCDEKDAAEYCALLNSACSDLTDRGVTE